MQRILADYIFYAFFIVENNKTIQSKINKEDMHMK